jgi:hypothetical protein
VLKGEPSLALASAARANADAPDERSGDGDRGPALDRRSASLVVVVGVDAVRRDRIDASTGTPGVRCGVRMVLDLTLPRVENVSRALPPTCDAVGVCTSAESAPPLLATEAWAMPLAPAPPPRTLPVPRVEYDAPPSRPRGALPKSVREPG